MVPQRIASINGFREPPMKGAAVRGISPTETSLSEELALGGSINRKEYSETSQKSSDSFHEWERACGWVLGRWLRGDKLRLGIGLSCS